LRGDNVIPALRHQQRARGISSRRATTWRSGSGACWENRSSAAVKR
jgi:hypothetical protein